MHTATSQQDLLKLAARFHLTDRSEAFGRCFAASLGLAQLARRQGIAVELVHWQVTGDRDFCDHWAVSCGNGRVIDLTRVQVDARTELLFEEASYPGNYHHPQHYPARLLLPLFERCNAEQDRLPFHFMWDIGILLARYDMQHAWHARQWRRLTRGVIDLGKFTWRTVIGSLQHDLVLLPQNRVGSGLRWD